MARQWRDVGSEQIAQYFALHVLFSVFYFMDAMMSSRTVWIVMSLLRTATLCKKAQWHKIGAGCPWSVPLSTYHEFFIKKTLIQRNHQVANIQKPFPNIIIWMFCKTCTYTYTWYFTWYLRFTLPRGRQHQCWEHDSLFRLSPLVHHVHRAHSHYQGRS